MDFFFSIFIFLIIHWGAQAYKICKGLYETDLYVLKSKALLCVIIFVIIFRSTNGIEHFRHTIAIILIQDYLHWFYDGKFVISSEYTKITGTFISGRYDADHLSVILPGEKDVFDKLEINGEFPGNKPGYKISGLFIILYSIVFA